MAPKGDGTIYQTPDGRWHASLVVAGTRYHRSARTRSEVVSKLRDLRGAAAAGRAAASRWPTVQEWITYCLNDVYPSSGKTSQDTIDGYRDIANLWIFPRIGRVRIDRLTVAQARETIYAPLEAGRSGSKCNHVRAILSRCLRIAEQEQGLPRNVARLVDAPKSEPEKIDPPTQRDARALLKVAAERPRNGARWVVALALGLRQGEALGLSWADIDFDTNEIHVQWQLKRQRGRHGCGDPTLTTGKDGAQTKSWPCGHRQGARCPKSDREAGLTVKGPKSRAGVRTIEMPEQVAEWLLRHREAQQVERNLSDWAPWTTVPIGESRARKIDLVFAQPTGRPINPRTDWDAWKTLLADANVPEARLHDARHTAATLMLVMGVDVKVVSAILGHSTVTLTMNTYQHLVPALRTAAAEKMSAALWGDDEVTERRRKRA